MKRTKYPGDDPVGCNYDPTATDNDGSCDILLLQPFTTRHGRLRIDITAFAGLGTDNPLGWLDHLSDLRDLSHHRTTGCCRDGIRRQFHLIGSSSSFYQNRASLVVTDIDSALPLPTFPKWHWIPGSPSAMTNPRHQQHTRASPGYGAPCSNSGKTCSSEGPRRRMEHRFRRHRTLVWRRPLGC